MLESFEAGFKAWLWPGFTAILAVAATYVVYRLALAVFRRFSESRTVIRLFLDAAARALGVVFCLLTLAGSLAAAPPDLPLMAAIQQITTLLLILA
ncbi:MAG TPA: mechanosensitive ion channel protein MscS, partial [Marinobacter adhaerens]|nr:mechanosensitive ion channel protein MscS [Marinobacter adhaerens]